jgi:hypothetical protein
MGHLPPDPTFLISPEQSSKNRATGVCWPHYTRPQVVRPPEVLADKQVAPMPPDGGRCGGNAGEAEEDLPPVPTAEGPPMPPCHLVEAGMSAVNIACRYTAELVASIARQVSKGFR